MRVAARNIRFSAEPIAVSNRPGSPFEAITNGRFGVSNPAHQGAPEHIPQSACLWDTM
jgi:hypothetical protein